MQRTMGQGNHRLDFGGFDPCVLNRFPPEFSRPSAQVSCVILIGVPPTAARSPAEQYGRAPRPERLFAPPWFQGVFAASATKSATASTTPGANGRLGSA